MLHKYHLHDQPQPWYVGNIHITRGTSQINIVSGLEAGGGGLRRACMMKDNVYVLMSYCIPNCKTLSLRVLQFGIQ